jgi:hypothetical protein
MTNANGWPDQRKRGRPPGHKEARWHWLSENGVLFPAFWTASGYWTLRNLTMAARSAGKRWEYVGECLTPQELAERLDEVETAARFTDAVFDFDRRDAA